MVAKYFQHMLANHSQMFYATHCNFVSNKLTIFGITKSITRNDLTVLYITWFIYTKKKNTRFTYLFSMWLGDRWKMEGPMRLCSA